MGTAKRMEILWLSVLLVANLIRSKCPFVQFGRWLRAFGPDSLPSLHCSPLSTSSVFIRLYTTHPTGIILLLVHVRCIALYYSVPSAWLLTLRGTALLIH